MGASNPLGIQYYKNLIAALKAAGIKPMVKLCKILHNKKINCSFVTLHYQKVTLYHWDLPQVLEDQDGWQNPNIATWFEAYADLCFEQFGADVSKYFFFIAIWKIIYLNCIAFRLNTGSRKLISFLIINSIINFQFYY